MASVANNSRLHKQRPKRAHRRSRRADLVRAGHKFVEYYAPTYVRSPRVVEVEAKDDGQERHSRRDGRRGRGEREHRVQSLEAIMR